MVQWDSEEDRSHFGSGQALENIREDGKLTREQPRQLRAETLPGCCPRGAMVKIIQIKK